MRSEGYSTWSVSLSVCVSVTTFSVTTRNKPAKKWNQQVQRYTLFIAIFVKVLRSKVMASKQSLQANMLISTGLPQQGLLTLCISWRHKSQQRACIDSRMLSTTVAITCRELLVGETTSKHK